MKLERWQGPPHINKAKKKDLSICLMERCHETSWDMELELAFLLTIILHVYLSWEVVSKGVGFVSTSKGTHSKHRVLILAATA